MSIAQPLPQLKIPCAECGGGPRNHDVLFQHQEKWQNDDGDHGGQNYQVCKCKGCDEVRFRVESWSTDDFDFSTNDFNVSERIYPEVLKLRHKPIETIELPVDIGRMYSETVVAFNAGAMILAGGGLRAIVEAICIEQKVEKVNLQDRIDSLVEKELLAKPQADLLHEERYLGNYSLHELVPPSKQEIADGLAIVEGLINTIYVLPLRAARLRKKREAHSKA